MQTLLQEQAGLPRDLVENATCTKSGVDQYYSNEDITVLHAVVAAAQNQLDHATNPKPLPAAVLFKAYDIILPTFGIDPDSDHHLSAFIFRIGGEQGSDTLFEKFQAILSRMGIVLEFGDNTISSGHTAPSISQSPSHSHSSDRNLERDHERKTHKAPAEQLYKVATPVWEWFPGSNHRPS
ncbi:hypothetical protein RJ55_03498 [Drechmeria coniospora]|nr:hypothetical protein RJ55_03498 [Drechmeria coniospora]